MPEGTLNDVVCEEHRAQLDAIAAELDDGNISPARRAELLAICESIAENYSCDARLCE